MSTGQHWQCFSNASVREGIQRLRVLNAHRLMSHFWINLSLEQEDRGKKGGQRGKRERKKTTLDYYQFKWRGEQWLLTIAVATVLCEGGQNGVFWLAGGQSVQCSVKRYFGRGRGGSKTLKAKGNFKQEFSGGDERVYGRNMNPLLPFSLSWISIQFWSCAIEQKYINSINLKPFD